MGIKRAEKHGGDARPAPGRRPASGRLAALLTVGMVAALGHSGSALAQSSEADVQALRQQLQIMQRRLDQLERGDRAARQQPANASVRRATADAEEARRQAAAAQADAAAARQQVEAVQARVNVSGANNRVLTMNDLRGDLPNSIRIPGTETSVRLYGFVKLSMTGDANNRNRSDVITAQSVPLSHGVNGSRTGGDFQASARRSRVGIESLTPINDTIGTLRMQVEGDFAGQNTDLTTQGTGNGYTPRLRQAWAELGNLQGWGTVLAGQANSLWNDSEYGSIAGIQQLTDWTGLAQSAVRQAQIRYSKGFGRFTIQASLENSYSDVTNYSVTSYPDSSSNGGAGWSMTQMPDFLMRASYRGSNYWADLRGMVRQLRVDNSGATVAGQRYDRSTTGWGVGSSGGVKLFDNRLVLMAGVHYGEGLGRYLDATSNGLGAVTNAGMAGVTAANTSLDTVSVLAGQVGAAWYFTPALRTNFWLAGSHMDYPSYVRQFGGCQGTTATGTCNTLNRNMWAGTANLIWSPVPRIDVGLEYQHVQRSLEQRNTDGASGGAADRIQAAAIIRF